MLARASSLSPSIVGSPLIITCTQHVMRAGTTVLTNCPSELKRSPWLRRPRPQSVHDLTNEGGPHLRPSQASTGQRVRPDKCLPRLIPCLCTSCAGAHSSDPDVADDDQRPRTRISPRQLSHDDIDYVAYFCLWAPMTLHHRHHSTTVLF